MASIRNSRRVNETYIGSNVRVSTVFLGDPEEYETMVFGGLHDGLQRRYSTEAKARAGHNRIVFIVRGDESNV